MADSRDELVTTYLPRYWHGTDESKRIFAVMVAALHADNPTMPQAWALQRASEMHPREMQYARDGIAPSGSPKRTDAEALTRDATDACITEGRRLVAEGKAPNFSAALEQVRERAPNVHRLATDAVVNATSHYPAPAPPDDAAAVRELVAEAGKVARADGVAFSVALDTVRQRDPDLFRRATSHYGKTVRT